MTPRPDVSRPFDLNELVRARFEDLRRASKGGIALHLDLGEDLPPVWADPIRIGDVLLELLAAACRAVPARGTIRITTRLHASGDGARSRGPRTVALSVASSGSMEPPLEVQGSVEGNQRTLESTSHPEGGTTCTLRLGAFPDTLDPAPLSGTARRPLGQRRFGAFGPKDRAILLVEDDPAVRDLLEASLARTGHHVTTASGGVEALHRILDDTQQPISLLVTDVVMPEMGGFTLARYATDVSPGLGVVFISGYRDREPPRGSILLHKPFSPETLVRLVSEKLEAS